MSEETVKNNLTRRLCHRALFTRRLLSEVFIIYQEDIEVEEGARDAATLQDVVGYS